MKRWIWMLPLLGLLLAGCGQDVGTEVEMRSVPVRQWEAWYEPAGDSSQEVRQVQTYYAYDAYGNCIEERSYEQTGAENTARWIRQIVRTFDEQGNLLTRKEYDRSKWFPLRESYVRYTYDRENRLVEQKTWKSWFQWDTVRFDNEQNQTGTWQEPNRVIFRELYGENGELLDGVSYRSEINVSGITTHYSIQVTKDDGATESWELSDSGYDQNEYAELRDSQFRYLWTKTAVYETIFVTAREE